MTKRDYIAIATILAGDFASATPAKKGKVFCITLSLADYFAGTNPNFKRDVFYAAVFGEKNPWVVRDRIFNPAAACTCGSKGAGIACICGPYKPQ